MTPELSPELSQAVNDAVSGVVEVSDPATNKVYVICDAELQKKAKAVLDREAIAAGLREVEEGQSEPLSEAISSIREKLQK